jgi:hypothetical protein
MTNNFITLFFSKWYNIVRIITSGTMKWGNARLEWERKEIRTNLWLENWRRKDPLTGIGVMGTCVLNKWGLDIWSSSSFT